MWCTHCVEEQQVVWGPNQDYIACSGCGKLFEFPVSKSHRMIRKPKKIQEKKHKHPTYNMSSTSTKSHGHELMQKLLQSLFGCEPYPGFHANLLKKVEVHREQWQARKQKKSSLHMREQWQARKQKKSSLHMSSL